jgi:hypothetical protein
MNCKRLVAYVRIDGKFTKIGYFGTECKRFEPLDMVNEGNESCNQKIPELQSEAKQISTTSSKTIKQDGETANLFGIKLELFCPNEDVTP